MVVRWRGAVGSHVGYLREVDSRHELTKGPAGLARVALLREEPARAAQLWQESLTLRQGIRDRAGGVACQVGLARVAAWQGDVAGRY